MPTRVTIDMDRCQGHGRCYDIAPEIFEADEEGYARVVGDGSVSREKPDRVGVAVANCPENAIRLIEED